MQSETQALCLAQALRTAHGIRDVDIKDVQLSPTAASRLSEALGALETVNYLCLANVALGDDGAEALLARTPRSRPARAAAARSQLRPSLRLHSSEL
jgi:Ran GTPase-activating protein (RanGAP) involved in mRNA processing and transport